jgi:ribosomal protein S18 acetylase RimI-like enzyme
VALDLVPYDGTAAELVVGWCAGSPFSSEWVPADTGAPDDVLARWLADPDISGYLLLDEGTPVAYGELWVEPDEDEAELAHLVVAPARRRRGHGRALAVALAEQARADGLAHVTLRVRPDNVAGISCYLSTGFVRESEEEAERFNAGQPAAYQWMRWSG